MSKVMFAAVVLSVAVGGTAWAQSTHDQDPSVGGQLNECWGKVASQLAKLDTPDGTNGGGMGQHSRSTQAANLNGGFTSDGNAFGITFNVKEDGGNAGRLGVGNATRGAPHFAEPGDGGNGQHAINNGGTLSALLNPVTGEATPALGGTAEVVQLPCDAP